LSIRYSSEHEWVITEGNTATVGISDYAQHALGDIVFVDLPKVGAVVTKGKAFGSVESVKAVSDLFAPVSGAVTGINEALEDAPELLNEDALANWIIKVEMSDAGEVGSLLTEDEYKELLKNEK